MDKCLFMNFDGIVTVTSCCCCYNVCFVQSAAISASMVVTFRNTQPRGVHRSKLWFIQLLYSYDYWLSPKQNDKTWTLERPRRSQTPCLENRPFFFTFCTLVPRPLKSVGSQAQGSQLQRTTGVAARLHS